MAKKQTPPAKKLFAGSVTANGKKGNYLFKEISRGVFVLELDILEVQEVEETREELRNITESITTYQAKRLSKDQTEKELKELNIKVDLALKNQGKVIDNKIANIEVEPTVKERTVTKKVNVSKMVEKMAIKESCKFHNLFCKLSRFQANEFVSNYLKTL